MICGNELCSHRECATIRRDKRRTETLLTMEFEKFYATIPEPERADFFHPINRDNWMRSFGVYLGRVREFASND